MADSDKEQGPQKEMDLTLNLFGEDIEKNLSFLFIDQQPRQETSPRRPQSSAKQIRYETVPTMQVLDNTEDMNSRLIFNEETLQESILPNEDTQMLFSRD